MLRNQVYIGNMIQGKRQVISFKNKKRRTVNPENWIVVENTHEAIIDRDLWDRCQKRMKVKIIRELNNSNQISLFAGLLRCEDCGSKLIYAGKTRKNRPSIGSYRCRCYVNNGDKACTHHYIQENTLSAVVLKDIHIHAILAKADKDRIKQQLTAGINRHCRYINGSKPLALAVSTRE